MISDKSSRMGTGLAVALGALAFASCGQQQDYANDPRPPTVLSVDAAVTAKRIDLSPSRVGSGPLNLTIANLSSRSLDVTLESQDSGGRPDSSGPINPGGTAHITVDVTEGTYRVSAQGVGSTTLQVGPRRPSAQNDLQLP